MREIRVGSREDATMSDEKDVRFAFDGGGYIDLWPSLDRDNTVYLSAKDGHELVFEEDGDTGCYYVYTREEATDD